MPSLTFYGGVGEIGGTKIFFKHNGAKVFLDFGMSFSLAANYFSEFIQPRKCSALEDFFEFKMLPDIKGIYRQDYLSHMGRGKEKKRLDAVFLSHAHADHAQYVHFLRKDIPIYCTEETKIILRVLEETGSNPLSDLVTACEAFSFYPNKKGGLSRIDRRKRDFVQDRIYHITKPGKKFDIGSIEAELSPVDHSMPGAGGIILYTKEGNLVYSGDIRFHGYVKEHSKEFVKKAKKAEPKVLVFEGTRIDSKEQDSEEAVKEKISLMIRRSKGLVFVEHPIRDLFRVKSIFDAAKENDREFTVNLKLAYLIEELKDLSPLHLKDLKILVPRKRWGLISKEGFELDVIKKDYEKWERDFIDRQNSITYKDLQKRPNNYVVSMSFWEINQLADIKPEKAVWIKSTCEPFNEEMEIDEGRKRNWLRHFDIKEYSAHASGHASGFELLEVVKKISPEKVYPVHTEKPGEFKRLLKSEGIETVLPRLGKEYLF